MNKKKQSVTLVFLMLTSMIGMGFYLTSFTGMEIDSPISADSSANSILDEGDVLYYYIHEVNEDNDFEQGKVMKIEVKEVLIPNNITYNFYSVNETEFGWDWVQEEEHDDHEPFDDYNYQIFNHQFSINPVITNLSAAAEADDFVSLITGEEMGFNCSEDYLNYTISDGTEINGWHKVEFELFQNNDTSNYLRIVSIINKTTGLCTYFEMEMDGKIEIRELCGWDLSAGEGIEFDFYVPDSYGFEIGDTLDIFRPEGHYEDEEGGESAPEASYESEYEDYFECFPFGDDINNPLYFNDLDPASVAGRYSDLTIWNDEDFYSLNLNDGDSFHVSVECEEGADVRLTLYNITGEVLGNRSGEEPSGFLEINTNIYDTGDYNFSVTSDFGPFGDRYNLKIIIKFLQSTLMV